MILPSSLFFFLKEGERAASCDLRWMQRLIAAVALAMARRNVRRSVPMIFQARSFSLRGRADWSPTARLDEHRLSANTIDLVCAFGEQRRPTALAPLILACALGELSMPTVEANSSNVDHIH